MLLKQHFSVSLSHNTKGGLWVFIFLDRQLCTVCPLLHSGAEIHPQRVRCSTIKRQRKRVRKEKTMSWTSGDLNRLWERISRRCEILLLGDPMQENLGHLQANTNSLYYKQMDILWLNFCTRTGCHLSSVWDKWSKVTTVVRFSIFSGDLSALWVLYQLIRQVTVSYFTWVGTPEGCLLRKL